MPDFGMIFFWLLFRIIHEPFGRVVCEFGHAFAEGMAEGVAGGVGVAAGIVALLATLLFVLLGWFAWNTWSLHRGSRA